MLNADPAELEKFGDLAHRWWDPNSEFKPLHDINPLRLAGSIAMSVLPANEYLMSAAVVAYSLKAWHYAALMLSA